MAAASYISKIPTEVVDLLHKLFTGQMPATAELLDKYLSTIGVGWSITMLAAGLLLLVFGWQVFRALVIANAAFFGGMAGAHLAARFVGPNTALAGMLVGGLMLTVMVMPALRYTVAVGGGLIGSFAGYYAWPHVIKYLSRPDLATSAWIGALIGLMVLGLLAFVTFRAVVMIITAIEGAMLVICGTLAIGLHAPSMSKGLRTMMADDPWVLGVLITIFSVVGFALQYNTYIHGGKSKPAPESGSGSESESSSSRGRGAPKGAMA